MVRSRCAAVAALGIGLALGVPPAAPSGAAPRATAPSATVDRIPRDERISEASGLAVGLRHPTVLWTHEDSGRAPRLFAVGPDGRTAATVRLTGVRAVDWEAIAAYRDGAGRAMLAVADTGDNAAARATVEILVLPEPALRDATVRPERVIRLRYPTGPVDAEALLVDPDGRRAFVVTKGFGSTVYEVPAAAWSGASSAVATLVPRAGVPLVLVTDGVMGPGGRPVLRTYGELAVLPPLGDDVTGGSLQPLAVMRLPAQRQGEGLALRDARTALVGSEGRSAPILRVPLTADVLAALAPQPAGTSATPARTPPTTTGTPTGTPTPAGSTVRTPATGERPGASAGGTGRRLLLGAVGALGAVVLVLVTVAVAITRLGRRRMRGNG